MLARDASTGALTQATDGTGCIVQSALAGCTTGAQLAGANAVAVSPDDSSVYVTSLTSNSVTSFTRTATTGAAGAEDRDRGLRDLPAGRRLLARARDERAGGAHGLA